MYQIEICSLNPKYLEQYICEFKKYYYEARMEDYNTQKFYLELFYRKLPRLISETIMEDYYKHIGNVDLFPFVDTMGRREEYLREYLSDACKRAWRNKKYYKANKLLLKCGEFEKPHKWGCEEKRIRRRKYKKGRKKTKYEFKKYPKEKFYRKFIVER